MVCFCHSEIMIRKMEIMLIFILALVTVSSSVPLTNINLNDQWIQFKETFEKDYDGHEHEVQRRLNWEENIHLINEHNQKADQGIYTYWLGINEYADMTQTEFNALMGGFMPSNESNQNNNLTSSNLQVEHLPMEVDWRKKGYVTEVKNQGECGGCWAFSATGSLEAQHFKNTGKLVSLSEQELIDCCVKNGCGGGLMDMAFYCIRDMGGIEPEAKYMFEGRNGKCRFNISDVVAKVSSITKIEAKCEECLQYAVATVGPVSAAIYSREHTFNLYKRGVYRSNNCKHSMTHGVLIVGYGRENGHDYWLVKNSWGPSWGLGGYIKIARNHQNMCGIASLASFPNE